MLDIDSKGSITCIEWYESYIKAIVSRGIKLRDYDLTSLGCSINNLCVKLKGLGMDINLNSGVSVLNWLKDYYKDDITISSCGSIKDIIELKGSSGDDTLLDLLGRYNKLVGRYRIIQGIYKCRGVDGFIRPEVFLTKSNRIMYKTPSILNIPKDSLWNIIDVRSDRFALYSIDIKAQEPTIMFNLTNKDFLFKVGDTDVYKYIYRECLGKECNVFERNDIKKIINLINYGGGIQCAYNSCKVLDKDSVDKIVRYYNSVCKFNSYSRLCSRLASNKVTTITNHLGSKVEVSGDIASRKRTIQNLFVQSLAADIMAMLVKNFVDKVKELGLEGKLNIYFSRIDEIILEVDKSIINEDTSNLLMGLFEHRVDDWQPFKVSVERIR